MQQSHESATSGPNRGLLSLYLPNPNNGYMEGAQRHRITDGTVLSLIAALTERDAAISEKNTALAEKKAAISERDTVVIQRDVAIAEKEAALIERDQALSALKAFLADRESCATCNTGGIPSVPDIIEGQKLLQLRVNGRITDGSPSSSAPSSFNLTEDIGKGNKAKRSRKNKNFSTSTHKIEGTAVKKQKMLQQTDQQNGSASKVLNVVAIQERKSSQRLGSSLYNTTGFPIPYCSCTGINQQCYRWGNGGWQSACCTNQTSMYPLPMNPNKKGCRVAGRKMSAGAFERLLERLASDGVDISCPVDLKTYWAKHGTNRYVTIK